MTDIMKGGSLLDGFQNEFEYDQWIGLKNEYHDLVSSAHFFLRYEASFPVMITIKTKTKYQNIKYLHSDLCISILQVAQAKWKNKIFNHIAFTKNKINDNMNIFLYLFKVIQNTLNLFHSYFSTFMYINNIIN